MHTGQVVVEHSLACSDVERRRVLLVYNKGMLGEVLMLSERRGEEVTTLHSPLTRLYLIAT